jgi:ABC-type transporter MlaC component
VIVRTELLFAFVILLLGSVGFAEGTALNIPATSAATTTNTQETDPGKVVENICQDALRLINTPGATKQQIATGFKSILEKYFAIENIGKFVLGPKHRQLKEIDLQAFLRSFRNMLIKFYSSSFNDYKSAKISIIKVRREGSAGNHTTVTSSITLPNRPAILVEWSLFNVAGRWKVFNAIIDGVSSSLLLRDNIDKRIRSLGGIKNFLPVFLEENKSLL